jgi:glycosyltransferase involved in cell wall biosynthesis
MTKLSVITITRNEEQNIADCLASVRWADELIVIDSGSIDKTLDIARQFTSNVLTVEWTGYGAARNLALDHAHGDWVLWLDADERVTPQLAEEIRQVVQADDPEVMGYTVARRAYFLGRWIKHSGWYPSRVTRLFRKEKARFNETRVHEQLIITGRVVNLQHDLFHYTDPNLHHYFDKFNLYTSLAAEDLRAGGKSFSLHDLLLRPPFLFVKMYFLRLGFLDGLHGLILCVLSSAYVFTKYAKLWELQSRR